MANEVVNVATTPQIVISIFASIAITGGTGNWSVGDEIEGNTSGAKAIIIEIINPGATQTMRFYYIDPFISFNGSEAITNNTDTGAATGSGAETTENQDIYLKGIANWSRVGDPYGGKEIRIKVIAGTIQFAINQDPWAINPSYTTDDELILSIREGNTLKMKSLAGNASFELTL